MKKDNDPNLENQQTGLPEDRELSHLLGSWQRPESPVGLNQRVFASYRRLFNRRRWWQRLLTDSIRLPIPIATAAVLLLCATSFLAARKATSYSLESAPITVPGKLVEVRVPVIQERIVTRVVYKETGAQKAKAGPVPISPTPRSDMANFRPVSKLQIIVSPGGNDEK